MATVNATEARNALPDLINRAAYRGERITIERRGKNVAALVPVDDLAILEALEDRLDLEAARKALKERGSVPWKQLKKHLGL
jgi:prevent-host-death family protein